MPARRSWPVDECCALGFGTGGTRLCDAPTCITYEVLDAATGELLWRRSSGGRRHGGGSRHGGGIDIPFEPTRGGQLAATDRFLAWYDLTAREVVIIDAATLREVRRVAAPGAESFGWTAPAGWIAVEDERGLLWIDPKDGRSVPTGMSEDGSWHTQLDGGRVLGSSEAEYSCFEWRDGRLRLLWRSRRPHGSHAWLRGRYVHVRETAGTSGPVEYVLLDADSGAERWRDRAPMGEHWDPRTQEPCTGFWVEGPLLVSLTSEGVRIYRRRS